MIVPCYELSRIRAVLFGDYNDMYFYNACPSLPSVVEYLPSIEGFGNLKLIVVIYPSANPRVTKIN